jgi:NAD(P)-dependent dehydrogenase (short-subunit alcohol dehydrogenase family)
MSILTGGDLWNGSVRVDGTQRVAVVTGGNRGLGFEIVRRLAEDGLQVVLASRSFEAGLSAVDTLGPLGKCVSTQQLDVVDRNSVFAFVRWLRRTYGRCDVLVNNAALAIDQEHDAVRADLNVVRRTMEVNLIGAWQLTQALAPAMRARRYGRIVNVSSSVALFDQLGSGIPAYRISKAALNALTVVLADDLRPDGVLVNACCPGRVATEMGGDNGIPAAEAADTPVWLATLEDDGPTGGFWFLRERLTW